MKIRTALSLLAMLGLSAFTTYALDNEGLIKLTQAGLDEETILLKMDQEEANYDLSTDGLIALKTAGISEAIIKKALTLDLGAAAPAAPTAAPAPAYGGASNQFAQMELPSIAVPGVQGNIGETYFTRVTFLQEKGKHLATNYGRGIAIPINTEVELVAFKKKSFTLRILKTGEQIEIVNIPEFTGHTVQSLTENYLSTERTPIEKLPEELQTAVTSGQLRLGMTKEIAIATRGYPPIHETPSTNGDRWVYWSSRFIKVTVVFQNDRLIEGRGIY